MMRTRLFFVSDDENSSLFCIGWWELVSFFVSDDENLSLFLYRMMRTLLIFHVQHQMMRTRVLLDLQPQMRGRCLIRFHQIINVSFLTSNIRWWENVFFCIGWWEPVSYLTLSFRISMMKDGGQEPILFLTSNKRWWEYVASLLA